MGKSFEDSFNELSMLVEKLQQGDLPLEDAISLFEKGMRLSFECEKYLDAASRRVEVLVQREGDSPGTEPFEENED